MTYFTDRGASDHLFGNRWMLFRCMRRILFLIYLNYRYYWRSTSPLQKRYFICPWITFWSKLHHEKFMITSTKFCKKNWGIQKDRSGKSRERGKIILHTWKIATHCTLLKNYTQFLGPTHEKFHAGKWKFAYRIEKEAIQCIIINKVWILLKI